LSWTVGRKKTKLAAAAPSPASSSLLRPRDGCTRPHRCRPSCGLSPAAAHSAGSSSERLVAAAATCCELP
jgi:hypothetical protein